MRTIFKPVISSKLLLAILVFSSLTAYAELPFTLENGVPKLAGVQIGMTAAQAKKALVANGYTPKPAQREIITHYTQGKDIIRFKPGKHDPVEWAAYYHRLHIKNNLDALHVSTLKFFEQFKAVFGNQAKCQEQKYAKASCEYIVKQGNEVKYQASMELKGYNRLTLYLKGNPKMAGAPAGGTQSAAKDTAPAQQKTARRPGFTLSFNNDNGIPKLAGVQIGMSAAQAKKALVANGYTPQPGQYGVISHYTKGKDTITFRPGKHDPVAWTGYFHRLDVNKNDMAELNASTRNFIDQFTAMFGNQAKCQDRKYGRANCDYIVKQGNEVKYQASMVLQGQRLQLSLVGNPKLAGFTHTAKASAPAQHIPVKHSRFTISYKNKVVYINDMKLGMPDYAVRKEVKKLGYKVYNELAFQINAFNDQDHINTEIHLQQLDSIKTREEGIQEETKNKIINALKASFGTEITCKSYPHVNTSSPITNYCNYRHREPGKVIMLEVTFSKQDREEGYLYHILLVKHD